MSTILARMDAGQPGPFTRQVRSISVAMPTFRGLEFLERVLERLSAQRCDLPWDFTAIDSSSDDGTWELLGRFAERFPVPFARHRIHGLEFDHGDTRNELFARTQGDLCVFLTQDAIPAGDGWLATLAKNFADEQVAAAYCRNVPRPDADLLTRIGSEDDPGYQCGRRVVRIEDRAAYARLDTHAKRLLWNFNDVASAVRREAWERHPYPRTWFGEDVLIARAFLEAGWTVVYDDEAVVEHSHDYDAAQMYERGRIDGRFNAEWLDRVCVAAAKDAGVLAQRALEKDRGAIAAARADGSEQTAALTRSKSLREALYRGLYDGGRTTVRHPTTRVLERTELRILYVVHGFPPETWAGTEIYTYNLAVEMQRRGHAVTVLARVPAGASVAEGGAEDFALDESEFQGLRVLRMTHRLAHKSIRESYQHARAEALLRRLLARERFDVVHFQHLIHLSAGLVHVAREQGIPTVITCNDYWAICARVQLIRPDGVRCEENMGSGCYLCVKEKGLAHIPRLKRLDRVATPFLRSFAHGAKRGGSLSARVARRWEGFPDLSARHDYVTRAFASADLCIGPSRFLRQKLLDTGAFDPHRFLYSDYGMRTDYLRALAKKPDPQGRVRFGFVGSLVWYKGGETLLRAMQRLDPARAVLNVHGDFKPEKDEHHASLQRLAGSNVQFLGRFDNSRLSEVYAEIDVLIVPSIWFENSPLTIHEAFLTHTPVVASDIGGMAELVRDGVDGLHFKAGDAHDLAAKLARFVDEPDLRERLSHDWMQVKTIAEDAASMEYRYRALACVQRHRASTDEPLLEKSGIETTGRSGPVEEQGGARVLVRPGGAVEYDVSAIGGGTRRVHVEQWLLAGELRVRLGGKVTLDGRTVGEVPAVASRGRDEASVHELVLDLPVGASKLAFTAHAASSQTAGGTHLRIQRVRVFESPSAVQVHA